MTFDLDGARKAGYSDDEIADFLSTQHKFDVAGARKSGYQSNEIVDFLSKREVEKSAWQKTKEFAGDVGSGVLTAPVVLAETLAGVDALRRKVSPSARIEEAINPGLGAARTEETRSFLESAGRAKNIVNDATLSDTAKAQMEEQSAIARDPSLGVMEGALVSAGQAITNPRNTLRQVLENLPSLLTGGAAMRAASRLLLRVLVTPQPAHSKAAPHIRRHFKRRRRNWHRSTMTNSRKPFPATQMICARTSPANRHCFALRTALRPRQAVLPR
jgi:hypothetical protein